VEKVDRERLAVRRLDIVDEHGVIRAVLAADAPQPIVGGIQYKRKFPASGLLVFDRDGNERGGYAVADIEGSAALLTLDHANGDAIGWRVLPDGSVGFILNERAPLRRDATRGGRIAPDQGGERVSLNVAADGTPSIALSDKQNRPRLRLTVTPEGFGALEFLDAQGKVLQTLAPEAQATSATR
jgi:hypothetical protein